jgi:hypothetical protein
MAYIDLENKAETQGTNYKTRDLLQDIDSNFAQAVNNLTSVYNFQFTNANLVSGVLTINHNLDTAYPKALIRRPDGSYEEVTQIMNYVTSNQIALDFGGSIETGTWIGQISK